VFGADSEPVKSGRVATVQAIGGTGGLKIGADFLKKLSPNAKVLISDPSWENHRALFTQRRFHGRKPTPTTTRPRAASTSTACWPR
jgi:aromatic-amino-acid transaminase